MIITAEIVVRKDIESELDDSLVLPHSVNSFVFRIDQPEKNQNDVVVKNLEELLDAAEYSLLNRSNLVKLKAVAKRVLQLGTELEFKQESLFPYVLRFSAIQAE